VRQAKRIAAAALGVLLALAAGAPTRVQAYCPHECNRWDPKTGQCIEYGPVGAGCAESFAPAASYGATTFWGLGDSESQAGVAAQNKCVQSGVNNCRV